MNTLNLPSISLGRDSEKDPWAIVELGDKDQHLFITYEKNALEHSVGVNGSFTSVFTVRDPLDFAELDRNLRIRQEMFTNLYAEGEFTTFNEMMEKDTDLLFPGNMIPRIVIFWDFESFPFKEAIDAIIEAGRQFGMSCVISGPDTYLLEKYNLPHVRICESWVEVHKEESSVHYV